VGGIGTVGCCCVPEGGLPSGVGIYNGPLYPQAATMPVVTSVATMRRAMRLNANWNTGNSVILAGSIMTETEFLALIDQVLDSIESQADDWAASLDVDIETSRSGNVLTLVFEDNTHVVVNSQAAMQELWVAARTGGFHYRYDGLHWNDTRGGPQLPDALSQICSAAAGVPVTIRL
jgi:CyaY protein